MHRCIMTGRDLSRFSQYSVRKDITFVSNLSPGIYFPSDKFPGRFLPGRRHFLVPHGACFCTLRRSSTSCEYKPILINAFYLQIFVLLSNCPIACYRLEKPILEIVHGAKTVFTRSSITLPKVNRFR